MVRERRRTAPRLALKSAGSLPTAAAEAGQVSPKGDIREDTMHRRSLLALASSRVPIPAAASRKCGANCARCRTSANLGVTVNASVSRSSLPLALENAKLQGARSACLAALQPAGERDADVIGYVSAIGGKFNSAEVYPSNGLSWKMWPKLLKASVTEAIGREERRRRGHAVERNRASLPGRGDEGRGDREAAYGADPARNAMPTRRSISRPGARAAPGRIAAIRRRNETLRTHARWAAALRALNR